MSRERAEAFLDQNLASLAGSKTRLARSIEQLAPLFPISAEALAKATPEQQDQIDAFLKRFEQVLTTLQDQVFRGVAEREGHEPASMSRRDVVELMERIGAVDSSARFRDLVALRNRLAHTYPHDPARQTRILNSAYEASTDLVLMASGIERRIRGNLTERD